MAVDHEMLDELSDWNHGWRAIFPNLSEVYVPGEGDNPQVMLRDLMAGVGLFTGLTPHFGKPNCWLTNVVHFRPPRNRTPLPQEITVARSGLRAEWVAVGRPRIIVPVGGVALGAIMGRKLSILKMAGTPIFKTSQEGRRLAIWPMIHPSFGLRNKSAIPQIEEQWDVFGEWLSDPYHALIDELHLSAKRLGLKRTSLEPGIIPDDVIRHDPNS